MGRRKISDYIKLKEVPKLLLEETGVTRTLHTVYNWIDIGRRNYYGDIVKLKSVMRFGYRFTTKEWVMNFIKEIG